MVLGAMSPSISVTCTAWVFGVLVFAVILYYQKFHSRSRLPLPPGPKGEPILGHLRVIPDSHPEYQLTQWGKEYSTLHYYIVSRLAALLIEYP